MTVMPSTFSVEAFRRSLDVFMLFAIPGGGGIPAGVLLAQSRGIDWPVLTLLYFVSDVLLACLFEPIMKFFGWLSKYSNFLRLYIANLKMVIGKVGSFYGQKLGPFLLIAISFGVDPMTGRSVALAQGHGFIAGWAIAITGDMLFFGTIMASTIWLNGILGNGTLTAVIIMVLMFTIPLLVRRIRRSIKSTTTEI